MKWQTEAPAKAGNRELGPGDAGIRHKGLVVGGCYKVVCWLCIVQGNGILLLPFFPNKS